MVYVIITKGLKMQPLMLRGLTSRSQINKSLVDLIIDHLAFDHIEKYM